MNIPVFLLSGQEESIKEAIKKGAKGGFSKDKIYKPEEKAHIAYLLKPFLS